MATMMIFQTSPPPHSFMYFLPDKYYYYVEILVLALSPPLSDTMDILVPIPMPMPMLMPMLMLMLMPMLIPPKLLLMPSLLTWYLAHKLIIWPISSSKFAGPY